MISWCVHVCVRWLVGWLVGWLVLVVCVGWVGVFPPCHIPKLPSSLRVAAQDVDPRVLLLLLLLLLGPPCTAAAAAAKPPPCYPHSLSGSPHKFGPPWDYNEAFGICCGARDEGGEGVRGLGGTDD